MVGFGISCISLAIFATILTGITVDATHGGTYHLLDSAHKEKLAQFGQLQFSATAKQTIPTTSALFDSEQISFGYAWVDLNDGVGIASVMEKESESASEWQLKEITFEHVLGAEQDFVHTESGESLAYCLTELKIIDGTTSPIENQMKVAVSYQIFTTLADEITHAMSFAVKSSKACESGLVITAFSMVDATYKDPFAGCSGLQGEELLACKGNVEAFDAAGACEGLTSLECLNYSVDIDGDGIHNDADSCPDLAETENGIYDEDGCPEDIAVYTADEIKEAYGGLTNKVQDKVPITIIDEFGQVFQPRPVDDPKLDTRIFEIQDLDEPEEYAEKRGLDYEDGLVRVLVTTSGNYILEQIKEIARVESSTRTQFQVVVEVGKINELSNLPDVLSIVPVKHPVQTAISVSEGVKATNADLVQDNGLTGKNIKVAIFDLGFDTQNEKISDNIKDTKSFRKDLHGNSIDVKGFGTEFIHGTAVAEIVTDMAPDTEIYLYTFSTELEFLDAVSYAQSKQVDLMTMSLGWMTYATNGESVMTKKIESIINSGIPFVVSAGNYAEMHWEGEFSDTDFDQWHEFQDNDEGLSFEVTSERISQKFPIIAYLIWEDTDSVKNDFNLALRDSTGKVIDVSSNVQTNHQEFEFINYIPDRTGTYSLGVTAKNDSPSAKIEIFSQTDKIEHAVSEGSVSVPTDANGIISVGAVHHAKKFLEPFSSQGPTNKGQTPVPTIVAPDAVSTIAYGSSPFYGTSAAAPHVAGLSALILESAPDSTPSQVKRIIQDNTDRTKVLQQAGFDNFFGYGNADAKFLAGQVAADPTIPTWVKGNAQLWAEGTIDDATFVLALQHLIKTEIIKVPGNQSGTGVESSSKAYPLPGYKETKIIALAGTILDYVRGTVLSVTVEKPDGEVDEFGVFASRSGKYSSSYELTDKSLTGDYTVTLNYEGTIVDSFKFSVMDSAQIPQKQELQLPGWIKTNAQLWADGTLDDTTFVNAIQYMITDGIIVL